ncbi:MAG: hypothetical protein ACK56I_32780, partial [bacterium]
WAPWWIAQTEWTSFLTQGARSSSARSRNPCARDSPASLQWHCCGGCRMNALRLEGFWSITEGLAALSHEIRGLLTLLGWKRPGLNPSG